MLKALVLSGGRATRLRPITHTSAKQLVPVANKPILFYALEAIRDAGIKDVGIIVGYTAEEVKAAVGDGSRWNLSVTYIPQEAPLGLAHAVKIAQPFLGNEKFVMFLGDNLIRDGIADTARRFETENSNAHIMLAKVDNPENFGVAEIEDNKIVKLVEKPKSPKSNLALVGVYFFDAAVFEAVNAISPSERGELEITDAIQYLIDTGRDVRWHIINGWWKDTGKLEDLLEANRLVLESTERKIEGDVDEASTIDGRVVIERDAVVRESVVRGPAIIGEGCVIEHAYIGPFTSICSGTKIIKSEIEHSIVMENSVINKIGPRIEDSLIGKNVSILKDDEKPTAYRLMLGDNSQVKLM